MTPIEIEIISNIKSDVDEQSVIYIEEGGVTDDFIQKPDGYAMEEGMEVILFLSSNAHSWGGISIYPVYRNKVILNKIAVDYIGYDRVSLLQKNDLNKQLQKAVNQTEVYAMEKEDFIEIISHILE